MPMTLYILVIVSLNSSGCFSQFSPVLSLTIKSFMMQNHRWGMSPVRSMAEGATQAEPESSEHLRLLELPVGTALHRNTDDKLKRVSQFSA